MDWQAFRKPSGEIDLIAAFLHRYGVIRGTQRDYLQNIMELQPITSRQLAAKCLVDVIYVLNGPRV